jgi:hypothetical protein
MRLIEQLHDELRDLDLDYSGAGMVKLTDPVQGRSFFPGGYGLFDGIHGSPLPERPVLVFGQDFGNESCFEDAKQRGFEKLPGTWSGLVAWLMNSDISPSDCFFTNAIMGVRPAGTSIIGPSPALRNQMFVSRCAEFALRQIELLHPSAVVALGTISTGILSNSLSLSKAPRRLNRTWREIDADGLQFIEHVQLPRRASPPPFALASSIHPSLPPNVRFRSWGKLAGKNAQHAIWSAVADAHHHCNM